jgi:cytidyltransferase-like protein
MPDSPTDTVYVDMVADLFHPGHINFLRQVKALYPAGRLMVGLMSDVQASGYKRSPILNLRERQEAVSACRYVDGVIDPAIMPITEEFIKRHQITRVIHGNDISAESRKYWYQVAIDLGIYQEIAYTPGISTTDIIRRVLEKEVRSKD